MRERSEMIVWRAGVYMGRSGLPVILLLSLLLALVLGLRTLPATAAPTGTSHEAGQA